MLLLMVSDHGYSHWKKNNCKLLLYTQHCIKHCIIASTEHAATKGWQHIVQCRTAAMKKDVTAMKSGLVLAVFATKFIANLYRLVWQNSNNLKLDILLFHTKKKSI